MLLLLKKSGYIFEGVSPSILALFIPLDTAIDSEIVFLNCLSFKADEIFNAHIFSSEVVVPLYEYCDFSISMIEAFIISKFFILRFVRSIETLDILYEFISLELL